MKIIQLTAENVKRLKVVDISPKGPLVQVTSRKNGQGKTSVLDSIWWALGGERNIQDVPLRKGAQSGRIRLNLGDLIVERKFNANGSSTITVRNAKDAGPGTPDNKLPSYSSPQAVLDSLIGRLSFDPLVFARMKPREQYDALKAVAKLNVDIDGINAANDADYKQRQDINREAKAVRAQAAGIALPANLPSTPLDECELINEIQAAAQFNAEIERQKAHVAQLRNAAESQTVRARNLRERAIESRRTTDLRIEELRRSIEKLEADCRREVDYLETEAAACDEATRRLTIQVNSLSQIPEPIEMAKLRAALDEAKVINGHIARREQKIALERKAEELEAQAAALTLRMAAREQEKLEAIKAAKMPVDDIGFGDACVTFKGLPLEQASDAEILRVSTEIAMAENPKLRVIRIRDGSLLDDDNLDILSRMAAEKDYQIWIEQVDRSGSIGVVLEDGEVIADNQMASSEESA